MLGFKYGNWRVEFRKDFESGFIYYDGKYQPAAGSSGLFLVSNNYSMVVYDNLEPWSKKTKIKINERILHTAITAKNDTRERENRLCKKCRFLHPVK